MRLVQQHHDEAAFATLYDRLSPRALPLAQRICWARQDAEEAVQDGFVAVWRSRANYDPLRGPVAPWVLAHVRHRAIDIFRRRRQPTGSVDHHADGRDAVAAGDLHGDVAREEERSELRDLLARLPAEQRHVIALAFFGQMTHTEIAAMLGIPVGTVKGRIRLGLEKTRRRLVTESASSRGSLAWSSETGETRPAARWSGDRPHGTGSGAGCPVISVRSGARTIAA